MYNPLVECAVLLLISPDESIVDVVVFLGRVEEDSRIAYEILQAILCVHVDMPENLTKQCSILVENVCFARTLECCIYDAYGILATNSVCMLV